MTQGSIRMGMTLFNRSDRFSLTCLGQIAPRQAVEAYPNSTISYKLGGDLILGRDHLPICLAVSIEADIFRVCSRQEKYIPTAYDSI